MPDQPLLLELPEQPERPKQGMQTTATTSTAPKLIPVNRDQAAWVALDVDQLIGADHKMRAIWELTGRLSLEEFAAAIESQEGEAGRPAWSPRVLVSVWLYAYSEGISSAREIEREMEYEPGLRWLTGLQVINHHTLSDFRVGHGEALKQLFVKLLVALERAELVNLERVMHDGTKVRAQCGGSSFRRKATVEEKLAEARKLVEEDPQADGEVSPRRKAAQQRAKREREEKMQQALQEFTKLEATKKSSTEKEPVRVSMSEPEARRMKHGDGGIAPSYNVQVSTDAQAGVIVGVEVSQSSDDASCLGPAMDAVKENMGRYPQQAVSDGGFTNREAIGEMEDRQIDFYGSLRDREECAAAALKSAGIDEKFGGQFFVLRPESHSMKCPAGKELGYVRNQHKRGNEYELYQAQGSDCQACEHQKQCCPRSPWKGRSVTRLIQENGVMVGFREKMESESAKAIYRQRGEVAEFPFARIKEQFGLRKFRVRGKAKAGVEAVWACLTYNAMIWIRRIGILQAAGVAA